MVLDIEVVGLERQSVADLTVAEVRALCSEALSSAAIDDGHLAVSFVGEQQIHKLNQAHRNQDSPTDVLSFPIDGAEPAVAGPRELGDVVICPAHTEDLREAVIHGTLHLIGMDHETDDGEMLARQADLLRRSGQ